MGRVRAGYTLFEVLLVLAIIIMVTAMALPSLESMSGYHKMNGCVDKVRGAWVTARAQAIEDSRPYRFSVADGRYRIAPDDDQYWQGGEPANDDNPGFVQEGALPGGVQFAEEGKPSKFNPDAQDEEEKIGTHANWVTVAIFLPDGTAVKDARFEFQIPGTRSRTILLRALTGTIEVKIAGEEDH